MKSPCIGCEFELADKNNPTCRECDRRVEYVALVEEGMNIEHSPATQGIGRASRMKKIEIEETAGVRIKECPIKGCDKEIYCRGLCKNHFQQWYKGYIDHPAFGAYKIAQPKKHSLKKRGEQIMDKNKTGSKPSTQSFAEIERSEGTKNKLADLNNHMFAQMERLSDEDLRGDKLVEEITRAKAISALSIQIISNARLMLDAHVKIKELLIENPPLLLGAQGYEEKD